MVERLKTFGEILIVTLSAYYLGLAAFNVVKPVDVSVSGSMQKGVESSRTTRVGKDQFNIINNRNLFAAFDPKHVKKPKPKPKAETDISKLPVNSSDLKLVGTIYGSDPSLRRAILIYKGQFKLLKQGNGIAGFIIEEVKRRAAVLSRGGKREILMIDKGDKKIAQNSDSGKVLLNKAKYKKAFARPEDFFKKVDFAPRKVDGKKGLLVNGLANDSLLAAAGIRKGDLIISVNGKDLNSFEAVGALAKQKFRNSIQIKVWRDKRVETLNLKLNNA